MPRRRLVPLLLLCVAAGQGARFAELRRPPEQQFAPLPPVAKDVRTPQQWPAARARLLAQWDEIIGPFPQRVPLETQVLTTEQLEDHARLRVRYRADADWSAEAYLLLPKGAGRDARLPGAVVLHQTSNTTLRDPVGLDGRETMHMALHLVRRGYVCIAPRNFLWGLEGKTPQQATDFVLSRAAGKTGMAKMTWDAIRAADVLLERPEVDPKRLCTIGHSLGGKEALYHAAFDERVRAAVSCEGGIGISFSNWDADWYLGRQVRRPDFGHDHQELLALVAPRAFLLIGGESADGAKSWPYIEANLPVWKLLGAEERIGLLRHTHGHDFLPPGEEREFVYRWLDAWVGVPRGR